MQRRIGPARRAEIEKDRSLSTGKDLQDLAVLTGDEDAPGAIASQKHGTRPGIRNGPRIGKLRYQLDFHDQAAHRNGPGNGIGDLSARGGREPETQERRERDVPRHPPSPDENTQA